MNVDISNLAGGFHNMGTISELGLVPNIRYRFDLRPIDDGPATGWGVYRGRYFSVNDKPIITSSTALSATVGQAIQVNLNQLTVSDDDDSVHTVGILAGANYTVDGSSFTFNESTEDGVHPVRVKVNDNTEDSDVYAIPVTVTGSSSNQRVIFIHTDLLGSPVAETDENGQPIGN